MHVLDLGLRLAAIVICDFPFKDDGNLVGPADGAAGIEQTFAEGVQPRPAVRNQVVAVLDLGKKELMVAGGVFALALSEERREGGQPLLASSASLVP